MPERHRSWGQAEARKYLLEGAYAVISAGNIVGAAHLIPRGAHFVKVGE